MPAWDERAVKAALGRVRLGVDVRQRRFGSGNRLGQGPGASLEFHDYRPYVPGDDTRQLDWGVLARSGVAVVRRHRVEVAPRVEIVLDLSRSMAFTSEKLRLATGLAAMLLHLALSAGTRPRLWLMADSARLVQSQAGWESALRDAAADGRAGLAAQPTPAFSAGSERLLVSDGLCPAGGPNLVQALGNGAGRLALIAVFAHDELHPQPSGASTLLDAEQGQAELVVDSAAIANYQQRLAQHQHGWQAALRGRGPGMATIIADEGFDAAVRSLLRLGILEARAL